MTTCLPGWGKWPECRGRRGIRWQRTNGPNGEATEKVGTNECVGRGYGRMKYEVRVTCGYFYE